MIPFTKNTGIQTVFLQQLFLWKSIQKESDALMPCANFGDQRRFCTRT